MCEYQVDKPSFWSSARALKIDCPKPNWSFGIMKRIVRAPDVPWFIYICRIVKNLFFSSWVKCIFVRFLNLIWNKTKMIGLVWNGPSAMCIISTFNPINSLYLSILASALSELKVLCTVERIFRLSLYLTWFLKGSCSF